MSDTLHPLDHDRMAGKTLTRLTRDTLDAAHADIRRPGYDPAALVPSILHLGCGAFHRGHQAWATQRAIEAEGAGGLRWGIASAALRRRTTPDLLWPQDGLYTLMRRDETGTKAEIVGSLAEIVHAPSDAIGLPARLADERTRIVTLTVTADGYLLEPSTGRLQADHAAIRADLETPAQPQTPVGILAAGLAEKRRLGGTPPVILSCDNLAANGSTLRQAVMDFADLIPHSDGLSGWIAANVQFPETMVDRIVPVPGDADIEDAARLTGLRDLAPVSCEPFLQWVIEAFDGPRPAWEAAGAQFVTDVAPFEQAKLRLLNGSHMLLAYLGALAGLPTIADTVDDPDFHRFIERFMLREQGATLSLSESELGGYVGELLHRLHNPAIRHEVDRIGRNGSVKLATRLMAPMRENLLAGRDVRCTTLGLAAWIRWFALRDTSGTEVRLNDPQATDFRALCERIGENFDAQASAFLDMEEVFGPPLPNHDRVVAELGAALRALHERDVRDLVAEAAAA